VAWNGCSLFDRVIDGRVRELDRQRWRRGRQRGAIAARPCRSAEIIGLVVRGVVWCRASPAARRWPRSARRLAQCRPSKHERDRRPGQIDGKRDQRKPRTLTDMIRNQRIRSQTVAFFNANRRAILSDLLPVNRKRRLQAPPHRWSRPLEVPYIGRNPAIGDHRSQRRSGFRR